MTSARALAKYPESPGSDWASEDMGPNASAGAGAAYDATRSTTTIER
jgi:hypothetical protein